jgi:hypothetical protein
MSQLFELQPFQPVPLDLRMTGMIDRGASAAEQGTVNQLTISYRLAGDLRPVLIPPLTNHPQRLFELWTATCLEFFIAPLNEPHYWEFNMSPSGDWNVFRLDGYRAGLRNEELVVALPLVVQQTATLLTLDLQLNLNQLVPPDQALAVAVTTVIQDRNGGFSYWALQHTGQTADFHRRTDFAIKC